MDMSFNNPAAFTSGDAGLEGGAALKPVSWHMLCARITATQDLRRTLQYLGEDEQGAIGSFHQGAASFLASANSGVPAHERIVNPNSSANGKATLGTSFATQNVTRQGRAEARD
jgi:hypothetical protein